MVYIAHGKIFIVNHRSYNNQSLKYAKKERKSNKKIIVMLIRPRNSYKCYEYARELVHNGKDQNKRVVSGLIKVKMKMTNSRREMSVYLTQSAAKKC